MSKTVVPLVSGSRFSDIKLWVDGEGFLVELKSLFDKYGIKQIKPVFLIPTTTEESQLGYIDDEHIGDTDKYIGFGMSVMEIVKKEPDLPEII